MGSAIDHAGEVTLTPTEKVISFQNERGRGLVGHALLGGDLGIRPGTRGDEEGVESNFNDTYNFSKET